MRANILRSMESRVAGVETIAMTGMERRKSELENRRKYKSITSKERIIAATRQRSTGYP